MKRYRVFLVLLMIMFLVVPLAAQEDGDQDADAPRRIRTRGGFFQNKMISVGLLAAVHLDSKFYDVDGNETSVVDGENDTFFGLSGRIYPLLGGRLGFGVNMILLDYLDVGNWEYSKWLVDVDLLYRMRIASSLVLNGGIGWSQYMYRRKFVPTGSSETEFGKFGYNLMLGAELFVADQFSITADWKWTYFTYELSSEEYSVRHLTFQIGAHYWF